MSIEEFEKKLKEVEREALEELNNTSYLDELEKWRVSYLGKKGKFSLILANLSQLNPELRPHAGQLSNPVKQKLEQSLKNVREAIYQRKLNQRLEMEAIDVTLPGLRKRLGHLHPITQVTERITEIFYGMGFSVAEGPEVETDYYNFDALNFPSDHPSRDEQDTFYTDVHPSVCLRSQTSTVQVRLMEKSSPPVRIIAPGRVYRNEEVNARKYPVFHQLEGLLVDKDVTFGQLKGTLTQFIRLFFDKPVKTRFRPDFFPFTEPSAELDSQCPFCLGGGCRTCGHKGWLELLGCGMVDPNVLRMCKIDSEVWSGFAFGMGIERVAMLKYGVTDIRHFFTGDVRFMEQF